ncbi:hypothetical protein GCM10008094_27690 [Aidingimonas halophila]|nr:hypothetical protein GCM10008094_27690 [Aidingimonas halophila]
MADTRQAIRGTGKSWIKNDGSPPPSMEGKIHRRGIPITESDNPYPMPPNLTARRRQQHNLSYETVKMRQRTFIDTARQSVTGGIVRGIGRNSTFIL